MIDKSTPIVIYGAGNCGRKTLALLREQGYEVLCASSGEDGLRIAREQNGSPIRLAITDVVLPQMDGTMMAASLKTTHPELKDTGRCSTRKF